MSLNTFTICRSFAYRSKIDPKCSLSNSGRLEIDFHEAFLDDEEPFTLLPDDGVTINTCIMRDDGDCFVWS